MVKGKVTSSKVASKASKILQDGRFSDKSKSVAGSALSQAKPKKKKQGANLGEYRLFGISLHATVRGDLFGYKRIQDFTLEFSFNFPALLWLTC